jgi:putative transcriptional regulator
VREFGSSSTSLAGSLVIASPSLLDPNFNKSVLLLTAHDAEEGSLGFILNRPAGRTVAEVLPDKLLGALARVPVFLGGPVATDQLVFASFSWHPETQRFHCRHHLSLEEAEESAEDQTMSVRAFIGYAGWSKGQLEAELAQKAWLIAKPSRDTLDAQRAPRLWRETLTGMGPMFRLIAEAPDDLTRN